MAKSAAEVRREFIEFFCAKHGHTFVPGSSVVPHDDPTLLFTNAGMNQFKPLFLGTADRSSAFGRMRRAANSQPCIRAGGKHNDLDDVGHDTYHHTFFEMLGNWSFGDYFKEDAIHWAWELITQVWGIDPSRLHATYFGGDPAEGLDPDIEARDLWRRVRGMSPERVHPGNKKDNFWEMGDTGPCGPCSEIHIDLTPDRSGGKLVNTGDHRVMEIWNLVFIQFNRGAESRLSPLPAKHVDTGMGFERVCGVLQGHNNNYATEVFVPLIQAVERLSGHSYGKEVVVPADSPGRNNRYARFSETEMRDVACRVIADHLRTLTFAITDGAVPDKDSRGYVLRRILRRGVRYGWQHLDLKTPFLHTLVPVVVDVLGEAFPRLRDDPARVSAVLREEEESFGRTLGRGIALFDEAAAAAREHRGEIRGVDAFKLHDTYGFPIDLTEIMAEERGLRVDIGEYDRLMEEARERARAGGRFQGGGGAVTADQVTCYGATDDSPKYATDVLKAEVKGLIRLSGPTAEVLRPSDVLNPGDSAAIVFDRTCFYAEQGGQVGDRGQLSGGGVRFDVEGTQRFAETVVLNGTLVQGHIRIGQTLEQHVHARREKIKQNHTATHVLNWALRETLGDHVQQKGSLVDHEKTRFDFSHPKPLAPDEVAKIESLVEQQIRQNLTVYTQSAPQADALKVTSLRAVFGEKYPDVVRVVSIGAPVDKLLAAPADSAWRQYSIEFCGGTHVRTTSEVGRFILTVEESVAKGVRRLVGVSGDSAELASEVGDALIEAARQLRSAKGEELVNGLAALQASVAESILPLLKRLALRDAIAELQAQIKAQQREIASQSAGDALAKVDELIANAARVGGATIVIADLGDLAIDAAKTVADAIKQKCGSAAILLGLRGGDRCTLLAAATEDLVKKGLKAGDWVKAVAPVVEGGGGGPASMAQAGGKNAAKLADALAAGREWAAAKLGGGA
ncbi:MAG: alanine--tRNA ligase [Planctomycetes bacterium]|nr:alanine--tRNA ligase [Planctomycetota bacterium]